MTSFEDLNKLRQESTPEDYTQKLKQMMADSAAAEARARGPQQDGALNTQAFPSRNIESTSTDPVASVSRPFVVQSDSGIGNFKAKRFTGIKENIPTVVSDLYERYASWRVAARLKREDDTQFRHGESGAELNRKTHLKDWFVAGPAYVSGFLVGFCCGSSPFSTSLHSIFSSDVRPLAVIAGLAVGAIGASYFRFGTMHLVYGLAAKIDSKSYEKFAYFKWQAEEQGKSTARDPIQMNQKKEFIGTGPGGYTAIGADLQNGNSGSGQPLPGKPELFQ